jgi:hypothetical protein
MSTQTYLELFQNTVDVIEHSGGAIGNHRGIENIIVKPQGLTMPLTNDERATVEKEAQGEYLAVAFLLNADRTRYASMLQDLENDYLQGQDNYPKTVTTAAYNVLTNWKQDPRSMMRGSANDGVSFANVDGETDDTDESEAAIALTTAGQRKQEYKKRDKSHVTCHRCRKKGHYANECDGERADRAPESQTAEQLLMAGIQNGEVDGVSYNFHQASNVATKIKKEGHVPSSWILLDNQSTVDVFHNGDLLKNIRPGNGYMDIHCNAGVTSTNMIGDLPGYGEVWYHPNGIANILSLKRVKDRGHRITYDSSRANEFLFHKSDGTIRVFKGSPRGLYYSDTNSHETGALFVNTVEGNMTRYTNRDYSHAVLARKTQKMIGRPSTRAFIAIVKNNLLPNCPITRRDIAMAEDIFGPDVGSLKGKTVRGAAIPVNDRMIDIPALIMTHHKNLILGGDIMFVNKIPYTLCLQHATI